MNNTFFTQLKQLAFIGLAFFSFMFNGVSQSKGDVLITEVLVVGGAGCNGDESEFIELYNTTDSPINVNGWTLSDGTNHVLSEGAKFGSFGGQGTTVIPAKGFLILAFTGGSFGGCTGTWPSADYDYNSVDMKCTDDDVWLVSPSSLEICRMFLPNADCATNIGKSYQLQDISLVVDGVINSSNVAFASTLLPGSTDTYASPGSGAEFLLPVELTTFSAKKFNHSTHLTWQTASEINNEGFEIERSHDSKTWETIGFIAGHGNTNQATTYEYQDRQPLAGMNYYRLKQMDFDGAFEYSKVVSVRMENNAGAISVYPNPVSSDFTLAVNMDKTTEGQIQIFDYSGKIIFQDVVNLTEGFNQLPVSTDNLQSGIYFVQMAYDNEISKIVKFVKK